MAQGGHRQNPCLAIARYSGLTAENPVAAKKKKPSRAEKIKKLKAQKPGLYRNINLKKLGAGKKKKAGAKSTRPKDADFKRAAKTAKRPKKKK